MRTLAVSTLLILLATASLAQNRRFPNPQQQPQPMPQRKTDLRVRVVTEDERPVESQIMVQLCNSLGVPILQNMTNDRGEVGFNQLDAGNYQVVVSDDRVKPEHNSVSFSLLPGEGMHMETVHVELQENAGGEKFVKPPTARISAAELNIPKKARKEFDKGNELLEKKKAADARPHFEKAIQLYPQYAAAYNNLGVSWMQSANPAKARQAFEQALSADPENGNAAMNLARMVYADKNWTREEDLLQRAIAAEPQNAQAMAMLTLTEFNLKKYAEAVTDARRTHALPHADYAIVHFIAARALVDQHNPGEAMIEYKMFLKEAPQSNMAAAAQKELEQLQMR